jgi:hypothetical protein
VTSEPDRVVLAVRGDGGLVVVRRAYQTIWRARAGGEELPVLPADVALTGIVVPAGEREVELFVPQGPARLALAGGASAAALLGIAALWPGRRRVNGGAAAA